MSRVWHVSKASSAIKKSAEYEGSPYGVNPIMFSGQGVCFFHIYYQCVSLYRFNDLEGSAHDLPGQQMWKWSMFDLIVFEHTASPGCLL